MQKAGAKRRVYVLQILRTNILGRGSAKLDWLQNSVLIITRRRKQPKELELGMEEDNHPTITGIVCLKIDLLCSGRCFEKVKFHFKPNNLDSNSDRL